MLNNLDNGVGGVLSNLDVMKNAIDDQEPDLHNVSNRRPLPIMPDRDGIPSGLWTSITAADWIRSHATSGSRTESHDPPDDNAGICSRILEGLKFDDMMARERQIDDPFPDTFQWLLGDGSPDNGERSSALQTTKFKDWLESEANETPFWITGIPASGKSTLMKFICTNPQVESHLRVWSGGRRPLICNIYFWNPGSSGQKSQIGLLRTMFHQLLRQRPDLCQIAAPTRYIYFQLAGIHAPAPPAWTVEELRDGITKIASKIAGTDCVAIFVDGLDEYEGDLEKLVIFLKRLHREHKIKLCVSSRPWNVFKDEFDTYPSLRMELFTKPDIEKYVRTQIGNSRAFQELRVLDSNSVEELESRIIQKANGVFLWVVLVVKKLVVTAQDNPDLHNIREVFETLPPGLEELYNSMRRRLSKDLLNGASRMYQILFQWNETLHYFISTLDFWMAINCHDPTKPQPPITKDEMVGVIPLLERQLAGHTGGMLQVSRSESEDDASPSVEFLHRTVFDWLQGIKSTIISDGPVDYDPSLVFASVVVSRLGTPAMAFSFRQTCNNSYESRSKLLRIIKRLQHYSLISYVRFIH